MSKEKKERTHYPFPDAPFADPVFGQPESCADLVNKYGTYNIQPTADTENVFPLISHALPEQWKDMAIGKDELDELYAILDKAAGRGASFILRGPASWREKYGASFRPRRAPRPSPRRRRRRPRSDA